jgi:DNA-binding transcriptional LysR family regulator
MDKERQYHDYTVMMDASLFSRSGMSLDRLRSFLALADAGGIAKAAPRAPVRQSQLSRQLRELEDFLGSPLAVRQGRGLRLTPLGERLARHVRHMLAGLVDIAQEAAQAPLALSLGAGGSVLEWWAIPRLPAVLERFPRIELGLGSASADLEDGRLDLGLLRRREVPRGMWSRPLLGYGFVLAVPRARLPRRRRPRLEEVLQSVPLALVDNEADLLEPILARAEGRLVVPLHCETFPQALAALRTLRCAAVLPTLATAELPRSHFARYEIPNLPAARLSLVSRPGFEEASPHGHAFALELARALRGPD